MTRQEQVEIIQEHAADLHELATNFARLVSVADSLSTEMLGVLVEFANTNNRMHGELFEQMQERQVTR